MFKITIIPESFYKVRIKITLNCYYIGVMHTKKLKIEHRVLVWKTIAISLFILTYSYASATSINKDVPKIRKFSFQENVVEGEMVTVTCITSSRSPTVNYAWMKNGVTLDEKTMRDNIRISNTEDVSVLILDPVHLSDNGNYSCSATNSFGKDQHTAHLNVKAPPRWLSLPSDVITTLGETIVVECSASGSPEPLVKFKKNSGNRMFEEESLGGKNVLRLKAVSYDQSGNYQCEADNGIFPAIVANFSILIRCVPSIRKFLFQDNVVEGDSVTVTCFAVTKTKPITFSWLKNDNTISERKQNVRYETGNEISNLILDPVSLEDSGNYTCSATNSDGTDNYTAYLNVKASPKWIEQPNDISTIVGLSVETRCLATGSPLPTIIWRKYTDKSQHSKEIVNSTSLKIPSVSHEDGGVYECTAQNGIFPNLKANFTLIVRGMKIKDPYFD